jgi:CRISPR-associated protein Cmr2
MPDAHLLLISLGPVQDFIAQARRSRDLWFGSHLLSELSRAAAASLAEAGARLIFPALDKGDPELRPCDTPTRDRGKAPVSVANKILAELPPGIDPEAGAKAARAAARARWIEIAEGVREGRGRAVLAAGIDDVWEEQIEEILEFYAVWLPLGEDYKAARQEAEQAVAGRKNLRDFRPWRHDRVGAPKSSLDGARVSVLSADRGDREFRRLRISAGEQLDAIGLVKRAGFEPEQFVPLVNIAAAGWLARACHEAPAQLAAVRAACEARGMPPIHRRDLPAVAPFPFDAGVLYPSRWPALFKELDAPERDASRARDWGKTHIRPLLDAMRSEPPAYVACLAADGDRMGAAIDSLPSAEANRIFSRALAGFPGEAREIVERHLGSLIYSGGDDILAFLPVASAADCAAELAAAFRKRLGHTVSEECAPTLSVGIGVGHVIEPMSILLDLARHAERTAKDAGRDALAIIVDKRSGGERRLALRWTDEPLPRLHADVRLLDGPLSTGKVHELEALLRRFPDHERIKERPEAARALAAYAEDILAHTGEAQGTSFAEIGVVRGSEFGALHAAIGNAIDRILVVRSLRDWGFGCPT